MYLIPFSRWFTFIALFTLIGCGGGDTAQNEPINGNFQLKIDLIFDETTIPSEYSYKPKISNIGNAIFSSVNEDYWIWNLTYDDTSDIYDTSPGKKMFRVSGGHLITNGGSSLGNLKLESGESTIYSSAGQSSNLSVLNSDGSGILIRGIMQVCITKENQETIVICSPIYLGKKQENGIVYFVEYTGGNSATDKISNIIATLQTNGDLPILDRSSPLLGSDNDSNGIRDDIDTYINSLPISSVEKKSLNNIAETLQLIQSLDTSNENKVGDTGLELTQVIVCVMAAFSDPLQAHKYIKSLEAYTANTYNRAKQYNKYNLARDGAVTRLPNIENC